MYLTITQSEQQVTLSLRMISYVVTMTLNFNLLLPGWHHS